MIKIKWVDKFILVDETEKTIDPLFILRKRRLRLGNVKKRNTKFARLG